MLEELADAEVVRDRHAGAIGRWALAGVLQSRDVRNLRAAVAHLCRRGRSDEAAEALLSGRRALFDAGAIRVGRSEFLALLGRPLTDLNRARTQLLAGTFAEMCGDPRAAESLLADGIKGLKRLGSEDPMGVDGFCYLGVIALDDGDPQAAEGYAEAAIEWSRPDDPEGEAMATDFLAHVARIRGDAERAIKLQFVATELSRMAGNDPGIYAQRLAGLARARTAAGQVAEAVLDAERALAVALEGPNRPARRDAALSLGEAQLAAGGEGATPHLAEAARLALAFGQPSIEELDLLQQALDAVDDERAPALERLVRQRHSSAGASQLKRLLDTLAHDKAP
jgi:tetratricopeptide (TPR) repeat protein